LEIAATLNATAWILHFSSGEQLAHTTLYHGPVPDPSTVTELQIAEEM
jgi:hypothetical protein